MSRMPDRSSALHLKLSRLPNALGSVRSETAIASFTRRDQNGLGLDSFEPFVDGSVQNLRDGKSLFETGEAKDQKTGSVGYCE